MYEPPSMRIIMQYLVLAVSAFFFGTVVGDLRRLHSLADIRLL